MSTLAQRIEMHKANARKLAEECARLERALAFANHRIGEQETELRMLRATVALHEAQHALKRKKEKPKCEPQN